MWLGIKWKHCWVNSLRYILQSCNVALFCLLQPSYQKKSKSQRSNLELASDLCADLGVRLLQCRGSSRIASERIHRLSLIACYSILSHARVLIPRVSVSDPYAPRTEKQIPFYQGFILVMRHGPYLTLTAAFLFITVAIQVNTDVFTKHFSDLTAGRYSKPGPGILTVRKNCWRSMLIWSM